MKFPPPLQQRLIINIRSQSQRLQARGTAATYITGKYQQRDRATGLRAISTASGGVQFGQYQSNSVPEDVPPLVTRSRLGLTGFIDQKPGA